MKRPGVSLFFSVCNDFVSYPVDSAPLFDSSGEVRKDFGIQPNGGYSDVQKGGYFPDFDSDGLG